MLSSLRRAVTITSSSADARSAAARLPTSRAIAGATRLMPSAVIGSRTDLQNGPLAYLDLLCCIVFPLLSLSDGPREQRLHRNAIPPAQSSGVLFEGCAFETLDLWLGWRKGRGCNDTSGELRIP